MEIEEELVDIVNENNEVVGQTSRAEAHKNGLIHRSLSVLVINSKGQILLQQRSKKTKVHPMSWDLSTSEHVLAGEGYKDAGKRSLKEELGIDAEVDIVSNISLQKREYKFKEQIHYEYELVVMLKAMHEGPFIIDPIEVYKVGFFSVEEIEGMLGSGTKFTPWFLDGWENVKQVTSDK